MMPTSSERDRTGQKQRIFLSAFSLFPLLYISLLSVGGNPLDISGTVMIDPVSYDHMWESGIGNRKPKTQNPKRSLGSRLRTFRESGVIPNKRATSLSVFQFLSYPVSNYFVRLSVAFAPNPEGMGPHCF